MESRLIFIGGGSGAGKTTLAEVIKEDIDGEVRLVSTDRFYRDFDDPEDANYDHPDSIDWNLMKECLEDLRSREEAKLPVYSFENHERKGFETAESANVIVLEGIFALVDRNLNHRADLRVYVETDSDIRFIRRLDRDTSERGRTRQSVIDQWIDQVKPMHREYIQPSRRNAHVIIPEDPDREMRETAKNLLSSRLEDFC
ncbi:MAG: uridine kinase [Candidatus Nanohaloarchaea archaeon]